MSRLCALALAREIEADYVHRLVRKRCLPPPVEAEDSWPWPVRIRSLGASAITLDGDRPVRSGQHTRPLPLLKALIALNPDGTSTWLLADELWSDADGDTALHALEVNLQLQRIAARAAQIAEGLGIWLHDTGAGNGAIDLYRRILEVDPLAETVCR